MIIYIPTFRRIATQLTWDMLPPNWKRRTCLVVHPEEEEEHRSRGRRVIVCDGPRGIAPVREWIIRRAHSKGTRTIMVLDDDISGLYYLYRNADRQIDPTLPRRRWFTPQDWSDFARWIGTTRDRVVHGGISDFSNVPPAPNLADPDEVFPGRQLRVHIFAVDRLPIDAIDWTGVEFAEDMHVTLQLMALGLPNIIHRRYRTATLGTGASGGCAAENRTVETHNQAMRRLIELHSPWVRENPAKARKNEPDWIKVVVRWKHYWTWLKRHYGYTDP